jgi:hypothetical protein
MDTSKHKKQGITTWTLLWRKLLLAQRFEIETELSSEECASQLRSLSHPVKGFFNPMSREIKVEQNYDTYDFEVRTKRYGRGMSYTSASARGTVVPDEALDKTVIRAEVRVSMWHLSLIALPLLMILSSLLEIWRTPWFYLLVVAVCAIYWFQFLRDRNMLIRLIHEVLRDYGIANASSGKKKKNNEEM